MGGSKTDPGIFINWSLRLGTTASTCITFDKFWPISRDLVFDIRTLELWVVNEVIMKRRNVANRDFYSTVVMWNRLGKYKANVKERDYRITEHRDCCFNNGSSNFRHSTNCSPTEVHETEQRHFETSHTSLTGTNTLDDELLIAIKNRLAGIPPMPGALSLKPVPSGERFNMQYQKSNRPQPYLVTSELSKPKKVPTPVATQVDDSMITELKHQGTSTSHVKVKSKFTRSLLDGTLMQRTENAGQLQHYSSRMKRDDGYQRSSHLGQNTQTPEIRHYPSRMNRVDEGFQRASHLQQNMHTFNPERTPSNMNQMDPQHSFPNKRRPNAPAQAAFPNYPRPSVRSEVPYPNQQRLSVQSQAVTNEGLRSPPRLPQVPHYYPVSGEPSISRNPAYNPQIQNSVLNPQETIDQQSKPQLRLSRKEPSNQSSKEDEALQTQPPPRVSMASNGRPPLFSYEDTPSPPSEGSPLGSPILAMATQQISRELNLACFCKKSTIKEVVRSNVEENWRDCGCKQWVKDDTSYKKNRKKEKEKKAKAEEKRRKKEEQRRKKEEQKRVKREKMEERARQKESRKAIKRQNKDRKKKSKKGKRSNAAMCPCCRCHGRNSRVSLVASNTNISQFNYSKSKKKSKKEKITKVKKRRNTRDNASFRPCECPPIPPVQYKSPSVVTYDSGCRMPVVQNPQTGEVQRCCSHPEYPCPALMNREMSGYSQVVQYCRMPVMQNPQTGEVQGCCSHPEVPCPALMNREMGTQVSMASSKDSCGDSIGPYSKRNNGVQITSHRSCTCYQPRTIRDCNSQRDYSGYNTQVSAFPAHIDPPPHLYSASPNGSNSPSPTRSELSYSRGNTEGARVDAMRYRDIAAAPTIIMPNEKGRGDTSEAFPFTGRWQSDPKFSSTQADNVLIDLSKRGREGSANKRYVPPCVLYLDCTKVKDLCVIIKDKYEDPS